MPCKRLLIDDSYLARVHSKAQTVNIGVIRSEVPVVAQNNHAFMIKYGGRGIADGIDRHGYAVGIEVAGQAHYQAVKQC